MSDKLEKVKVGSLVVLGGKDYWHIGTVASIEAGDLFRFKSEASYRDEFIGNTFYARLDELEYVENA